MCFKIFFSFRMNSGTNTKVRYFYFIHEGDSLTFKLRERISFGKHLKLHSGSNLIYPHFSLLYFHDTFKKYFIVNLYEFQFIIY